MTSGASAVGIELAFNTIGWKPTNLLFAALDALLGDPLISSAFGGADSPALTEATITDSTIDAAGDVIVERDLDRAHHVASSRTRPPRRRRRSWAPAG